MSCSAEGTVTAPAQGEEAGACSLAACPFEELKQTGSG